VKVLEIRIPDDTAEKIEASAQEKGVSVDELVRQSVEEKFARDKQFEKAARHVLDKNADLYKRLS